MRILQVVPIEDSEEFAWRSAAVAPCDGFPGDATIPSSTPDSLGSDTAGTGGVAAPFQANALLQCLARCQTRLRRSIFPDVASKCKYRPAEPSAFHLREAWAAPGPRRLDTSQSPSLIEQPLS